MILLEVCVDTPAGLLTAIENGADRIELCSALATGGLTPTVGLMALAATRSTPTRAMIRPRGGAFVFDVAEREVMLRDIDAARDAGLEGIVIGASGRNGTLDRALLERLVRHAHGLKITLHRVVDLLPDPVEAVDLAVALGISTILTSGGACKAVDGVDVIAAMHERASGRVEILAGSGVNAGNAPAILAATGIASLHASCSSAAAMDARLLELGFETPGRFETDGALVAALRHATNGA